MRDLNRSAIFRVIVTSGPVARTQIAKTLGLSPATVTAVTRELLDQGVVRVAERVPSNGGRPRMLLELVGSAANAFGVKIAPDRPRRGAVDLEAQLVQSYEAPFDASADGAVDSEGVRSTADELEQHPRSAPVRRDTLRHPDNSLVEQLARHRRHGRRAQTEVLAI